MSDEKRGITIHKRESGLTADCDLFATRDGRLVKGDDPEANMLVAREGMPIPDSLVESLGIEVTKSGRVKEPDDEGEPVRSEAVSETKGGAKEAADPGGKTLSRESLKRA